jgi:SynChlorMet cassette radical SAM/SPASM protein ScmF
VIVSSNEVSLALRGNGVPETDGRVAPQLNTLYFYLTEGCNLRCRHCWIEPKFQTEKKQYAALEPSLFRHIVRQAKELGLRGVKLTGGEPLMHSRIGEILGIIREEGVNLTMETNGVLCSPELADDLRHSNLRDISLSLDGADRETHEWVRGVEGCFEATLQGIRNLVAVGIRPQVIMTLMRRNVDQMEALIRLAESVGASSVKFNLIQPTARGVQMHQAGEALSVGEYVKLGDWVENELARRSKIHLHYSHPPAFRPMGKICSSEGAGCGVCGIHGILGVLADGSYALCGIGETVPELIFGHAAQDALPDVWVNHPVLRDIREGMPKRLGGVCGECLMKGICFGSCVAQNYYRDRSLWAPFWFCEEARELSLFPVKRLRSQAARDKEPERSVRRAISIAVER